MSKEVLMHWFKLNRWRINWKVNLTGYTLVVYLTVMYIHRFCLVKSHIEIWVGKENFKWVLDTDSPPFSLCFPTRSILKTTTAQVRFPCSKKTLISFESLTLDILTLIRRLWYGCCLAKMKLWYTLKGCPNGNYVIPWIC